MKAKEGEKEKTLKSDSFLDAKKIPPSLLHSQSNKESLMRSKLPGNTSGHQQGC